MMREEDTDFCTVCGTVTVWDGETCTGCGRSWGYDQPGRPGEDR